MKKLLIKAIRSFKLIKLLVDSEVIVPVTGHGKGKYRFSIKVNIERVLMPFAKMSKTNRRTDILPNLVAVFRIIFVL